MSDARGSAMLTAIFVLVFLVGLGSALLFVGQSELDLSRSTNDERIAFHLAEAGIEAGRMQLHAVNPSGDFAADLDTAAGADDALSLDPGAVRPLFDPGGVVTAIAGVGDDVPIRALTALASPDVSGGFYAAFLTNDPVEGIANPADLNRRVMITSIGVGPHRASEVVQAILEPDFLLPPPPTAAMTLIGPDPVYDNGPSGPQDHSGTDCPAGGGTPGLFVPIVGTTSPDAEADVEGGMHHPENFESGSLSGVATVGDLTNPSHPTMAQSGLPSIDPIWLDCDKLAQLVQKLIGQADLYCNTDFGSCSVPAGSPAQVIVIDGDADAGSFEAGVLLVTGTLRYGGGTAWDGIVLVIGEGEIIRNGGGNGANNGVVVVAKTDPSPSGPRANKSDWCAGGFGSASYTASGGGNSTIAYCSDIIELNNPLETYRVSEFLQQ